MKKEEAAVINMAKYNKSEEIHDKCVGCAKVFEHTFVPAEGEAVVILDKCLTYIRPAKWWENKSTATQKKLIVSKTHPKGIWVDTPAAIHMCPVATHVEIEKTPEGVKVNPLKAAKRAQSGG